MRYVILVLGLCLLCVAQVGAQNYYWISFTDKNHTSYSLDNPEEYLSERAIERRIKQNIAIDSLDLPVNQYYIDSILTLDVEQFHTSKWLNGITVKTDVDTLPELIQNWSFVKEVQLTKPSTTSKSAKTKFVEYEEGEVPIDTSYYGESVYQVGMLNGQFLHNDNYKGQGMQIAVIDAGFINADTMPALDSLWINDQILGTKDFLNLETDIFSSPNDYHGMSVLSAMGGNIPGQLIGTAPKASFWLIRSENTYSEYLVEEDNWVAAAEFADSAGVDVINSSLGYYEFNDSSTDHTYADMDGKTTRVTRGANIAASRGILVFTSAGNERYNSWFRIIAPSDGDDVIGVGAVDKDLVPGYFSSAGPASDGDIKPNVAAMGVHTVVQLMNGMIGKANGTSFSSPVMAGMAACLWQKNPDKTAAEVKKAIEESGNLYLNPDSLSGYGVPDMQVADELLSSMSAYEIDNDQNWTIYPNPVGDYLVVQSSGAEAYQDVEIRLVTLSGHIVKYWSKQISGRVVLEDIPSGLKGMFLLQLITKNYSETFKLVKK